MRRQSGSQITGREGERWFQSRIPAEWSVQKPADDFGTDCIVAIGDSKNLTPYEFGVQVKSSANFKMVRNHIVLPRISREEIEYWSGKFIPTLIVAFDTKDKVGFFEWISNLVSITEFRSNRSTFYLHIDRNRQFSDRCWEVIKGEVIRFHNEFSIAMKGSKEIIPLATNLASLLRNLCVSRMADVSVRDEQVAYVTAQAWTHPEVIRQLDRFIPGVDPESLAAQKLKIFRDAYMDTCKEIFHEFERQLNEKNVHWIMMKKGPLAEAKLVELTARLSSCVSGLLAHIHQFD